MSQHLIPFYTVHAANPEGDVYGFVNSRPTGGYLVTIQVTVVENGCKTDYYPALPVTEADRKSAIEICVQMVEDFDWELDHPWLKRHARNNALASTGEECVEQMLHMLDGAPVIPCVPGIDVDVVEGGSWIRA